jgi:lipid-A-disaccharide synthase
MDPQPDAVRMSARRVLLVAGEASGDLHGAMLVDALHRLDPTIEVAGVGGSRLRAAGMQILVDTAAVATMGFVEILGSAARFWRMYRTLVSFMEERRPALLILIDYPEFNLLLAKRAKALGIRVFYYISPQVWAWRRGRVRKIAQRVDRLAVVFPFEPALYEAASTPNGDGRPLAEFVGHPLLDLVRPTRSREETRARYGLDPRQPLLAILPGSRRKELRYLLVPGIAAARQLRTQGWQAAIALASTLTRGDLQDALAGGSVELPIVEDDTYNLVHAADAVVVASGTATLETALLQRPMVIMYRVSPLTYAIARRLVNVDHIGLPNILLGRGVFPELIQDEVTATNLSAAVRDVHARREELAASLAAIRGRLGEPGAAARAAHMALELMS